MATLQILNPKGMIKDTNNTVLPNEFFSHTQNARFEDNAAKKVLGQDQVFGTPTVAPYFALNWTTGANSYWFYILCYMVKETARCLRKILYLY